MLLSEAILLGSVSNKQAFGVFKDLNGGTCAIGAAMEACGLTPSAFSVHVLVSQFPYSKAKVSSPVQGISLGWGWGDEFGGSIYHHIVALNNDAKWTRPQIAAWVAEKERELGIVGNSTHKEEVSTCITTPMSDTVSLMEHGK